MEGTRKVEGREKAEDVRVRAAQEDELELIVSVAHKTVLEDMRRGDKGYQNNRLGLARSISEHYVRCWSDPRYLFIVAEDGDVGNVGVLVGMLDTRSEIYDPNVVGVVEMIWVLEEYRRARVGLLMLGMFEGLAIREGVRKFEGRCYQNNLAPQWGLLKAGYEYESVRMVKYVEE